MALSKKSKILVLPVLIPYPTDDGGKICVFGFIDFLRKVYDFTIFFPVYSEHTLKWINELKALWPEVRIEYVELFGNSTKAAPVEKKQTFFDNVKATVSRRIRSTNSKSQLATSQPPLERNNPKPNLLQDILYLTPTFPYPAEYIDELQKIFLQNSFDIVQVELSRNLDLVNILPKSSKLVFEHIESRFKVIKDYAINQETSNTFKEYVSGHAETIENAFISKFDAVFTLNDIDRDYLKGQIPHLQVYTSAFGVLDKDIAMPDVSAQRPTKLIFSGHEEHHPNYDALEWYLEKIHSLVIDTVDIKLVVSGKWSDATRSKFLANYRNLEFSGFVDEYNLYIMNSIMIVPMRIGGGGLRTKILYAMANNVPVISTNIGAVGIGATDKENIYIQDFPEHFAKTIKFLLQDDIALKSVRFNAYKFVVERYSQTATAMLRKELYQKILHS